MKEVHFVFVTEEAYQDKLRKEADPNYEGDTYWGTKIVDYKYTREFVSDTLSLCVGENVYLFSELVKDEFKKLDDEYIEFICNIWQKMLDNIKRIKNSVNKTTNFYFDLNSSMQEVKYIRELLNKHKGSYLKF